MKKQIFTGIAAFIIAAATIQWWLPIVFYGWIAIVILCPIVCGIMAIER